MEPWMWVVLGVVVLAAAVLLIGKAVRTRQVKNQFGPEYERVSARKGKSGAVRELSEREKRREALDIRPLHPDSAVRYRETWTETQARFVDRPDVAVKEADSLVTAVMQERGYPMQDFDRRAADLSVDHPEVIENYRSAHHIAGQSERGETTTESLRQAMVHYRSLFDKLLETDESAGTDDVDQRADHRNEVLPRR